MPQGPADREPATDAQIVGGTQYGSGMADADTRIDRLKGDIRAVSYSVLDLQEKATAHDAKFAEILLTLRAHGTKLQSHDRRFEQIDGRFEQIDGRFDQIDGRFEQMDGRFEQVDATLAEILARLPQAATSLRRQRRPRQ
jgi:pilus assembly protein FimV